MAPPDKLVPLPRATNGTFSVWHRRTVSMISSRRSGSTTARGRVRNAVRPSDSYGISAARDTSSRPGG
jgi:hypothetical protein